jgi:4-diphosphocytidyl-2-C-methyl-D-erythritol kinase
VTVAVLRAVAPGKVNLCLFLGPRRDDGLHELVSLVQPLDLADEVTLEPADADEVVCPGVEGENLAARALAAYREASGWEDPQRLTIEKRVPVAAGMGGGSSDAAATLRLAAHAAGRPGDPRIRELAPMLGSDVPALLHTSPTLVSGAGETVEPLEGRGVAPPVHTVAILPSAERLSTAEVYAEADRLAAHRSPAQLAELKRRVASAVRSGGLGAPYLHNDLEPAARALCPAIDDAIAAARSLWAAGTMVSGSGPTVVAFFTRPMHPGVLDTRWPGATIVHPASPQLAEVRAE